MNATETRLTRRNAANSPFLAQCKILFNAKIYRHVMTLVNDPTQGEAAARAYLLKNVVRSLDF
jgi:hypothetical protein